MKRWLQGTVLLLSLLPGAAPGVSLLPQRAPPLLFDVDTIESLSLGEVARRLSGSKVVIFGEHHDSARDHEAQLQVIKALHEQGLKVSVGFEVFGFSSQPRLDAFVAGTLSETELLREFQINANQNLYRLFRRIFLFCREKKIPMVGIRADTDILVRLFFEGHAKLSEAEMARLPGYDPLCRPSPKYESLMKQFADTTPPFSSAGPEEGFTCDFFMGLDSVMGFKAAEYVKANPDRTLVVLAGIAHAWKTGIPLHIARHTDAKVSVILPSSERDPLLGFGVFHSDADYVWWHQ